MQTCLIRTTVLMIIVQVTVNNLMQSGHFCRYLEQAMFVKDPRSKNLNDNQFVNHTITFSYILPFLAGHNI